MKSHRVNLTLSEGDYQRLLAAAASEGKMPSAFAGDVLKAFLMRDMFKDMSEPSEPFKSPPKASKGPVEAIEDTFTRTLPGIVEKPAEPRLNRAERRELARLEKRRGK